ncbi:alpha-1,3-mannosyl-glycoprotein 2-beta-N-acetylglucosaminyltransferase-like [Ixodes scapularis]
MSRSRMKKLLVLGVLIWTAATSLIFLQISQSRLQKAIHAQAEILERDVRSQLYSNEEVLDLLKRWKSVDEARKTRREVIAVLVLAYNRLSVETTLKQLLRYRPPGIWFPIVLSQDGFHEKTAHLLRKYQERHGFQLIHQPDQTELTKGVSAIFNIEGYHRIARHYRWALNMVFNHFNYSAAIVLEDDLDIAPDFFEYFGALMPILRRDPSLFCVSAYNDNGKLQHVSSSPDMLHRTDFFSGLGWLLTREVWHELEPHWPKAFWDDWIRQPEQRKGRACVRPEISRSRTFGRKGVSRGQFFDKYLKDVHLSSVFVKFGSIDLTYLLQHRYDPAFDAAVSGSSLRDLEDLLDSRVTQGPVRITYTNEQHFKVIANYLGIMDDFKAGVPRTAYKGIVSTYYHGVRVFIVPRAQQTTSTLLQRARSNEAVSG